MKTNIGILVDNDLNNDKRVLREASLLAGEGYSVHVLCFGFDGKEYPEINGINIERIRISRRIKNILFFFQNTAAAYRYLWVAHTAAFIRRNNIEVIHAHDLYMAKPAADGIRRSRKKLPLILDLHENYPYAVKTYNWTKGFFRKIFARPGRWEKLEGKYLGYADRIIVLSNEFAEDLQSRYKALNPGIFTVFPNVPDLSESNAFTKDVSRLKFVKKAPVIFYFGIVAERRGIFEALAAFRELVAEGTQAQFLIIGPADRYDRDRFLSEISDETLSSYVAYIPWIDLEELMIYLDASDICLAPFLRNPQHDSGIANKVFDYMQGKKPIVASDCKPQKNLIEQQSCGLVYSNREELKGCLRALLTDPGLRETMGEKGYNAILSTYNLQKVRQNLLDCYSDILQR